MRIIDIREDPTLTSTVEAIENQIEEIQRLFEIHPDFEDPEHRLFSDFDRQLRAALEKLKVDAFSQQWAWFRRHYSLLNIPEDGQALNKLQSIFVDSRGLDWEIVQRYAEVIASQTEELAEQAILKKAQENLERIWDHSGQRFPTLEEINKGKVLKLKIYRNYYAEERIGSENLEILSALDKCAAIVFNDTPASLASSGELYAEYSIWARESADGKREFQEFFASSHSFKNGRFDLTFRSELDAARFGLFLLGKGKI